MQLPSIKKICIFMIPVFIIIFMSYQHSKVIEGATGSKSSSDEKSLAYKNAATADHYMKNQCTNDQLSILEKRLDNITLEMQTENEKIDMAN